MNMSNVIVGKKEFSHNIEIPGLYNSTILDCQVRTLNLFTKKLSKKNIAVFGDYDMFVFYSYTTKEGQLDYKVKTIKKEFCEIILYEEKANYKDVEMIAECSSKPTCEFRLMNSNSYKIFLKIEIFGELKVYCSFNEENATDKKLNKEEEKLSIDDQKPQKEQIFDTKMNKEENESEIWQFEEEGDFSIQELLELDIESLKTISEQ